MLSNLLASYYGRRNGEKVTTLDALKCYRRLPIKRMQKHFLRTWGQRTHFFSFVPHTTCHLFNVNNNNNNNKIDYSVRNDSHCIGTIGDSGKEWLKRLVFKCFLKTDIWRCRRDAQRQSVPSTVGQQRPEKLDRQWLKDECVGQKSDAATISMQTNPL